MKRENKQFVLRMRVVFGSIVLVGFALIANLFYIQISNGAQLRDQADGQYIVSSYNSFERGSIFFEERDESRITAAGQKSGYKLSINPREFAGDRELIYENINSVTSLEREEFYGALEKEGRTYIEILNNISKEDGLAIKGLVGKHAQLHSEKWRVYPLKNSAAHTLGLLGYREDDYAGRYGLERQYEDTLKREDVNVYTNFFARTFHNVQNIIDPEKIPEGDIITTIDPQIQLFFEKQLESVQDTWRSESVGGIIMHPRTGEIYAMGAFPNFNNNDFSNESVSVFKNPLVENVYEMGSIMKPLIVATAIDSESIDTSTFEYYDTGSVEVGISTIKNFDGKGRGWINTQEILNQSLNTGMVEIASKIPKQTFRDYFENLGLTTQTNIDLPNEAKSISTNLKSNRDIEFANMSFGQGIAVSPINMVRSLSALANGGKTVQPHVVSKIEYTNGFSKTFDYSEDGTQAITKNTSGKISQMLVNVFDAYRDGGVKLPDYRIAAKTGTAQIPNPEGGYYEDRNLHSFFGYFPAYDPEFIVFLYTVHPKGVKYASQTLIEPFRETSKYLINYYNIPPDR
ncbi:MAG: stage V sporulation protein D (sporulation-specific penicillin-binding protein) [Candidatus Paceibacteria bacterium]|jgi:stage V sporulation protein D (sporulation-specific penicillin-binding protein)